MFSLKFIKIFIFSVLFVPFIASSVEIGEKIDLDSVSVTAKTCAEKAIETQDINYILNCPILEGRKSGYVIFSLYYNEYYIPKSGTLYIYQLENLYSTGGKVGTLDGKAKVVDIKDGIPVIEIIEIYDIRPRFFLINNIYFLCPSPL